jgi:ADP-ribosylglycohydrolase
MSDVKQQAWNAMIGLAVGDAMSWTSMFHRSFLLPPWTRRKRREIDAYSETTNVIIQPMPFSLNQPAEHFNIAPTFNTEWAAFATEILISNDYESYPESVLKAWNKLAQSKETIRGSVATQTALSNLKKGLQPPQSGKENPHYFDDSAMSRAVPIGIIYAGKPDEAARLAEIDASVTNNEDGIWAAKAMAAAISLVCSGKNISDSIEVAHQYLPRTSWIRRTVEDAFLITRESKSIFSVLPELQNEIVNREYSYGNVAPETLALTFAIARLHENNFDTAVMTAASFAKSSETLPAMVGALVGAAQSTTITSDSWLNAISKLKGICISSFAGKNYLSLVEQLSNLSDN